MAADVLATPETQDPGWEVGLGRKVAGSLRRPVPEVRLQSQGCHFPPAER